AWPTRLTVDVGARELQPSLARAKQFHNQCKGRVFSSKDRGVAEVIEDNRARQRVPFHRGSGNLLGRCIDLNMPTERSNPFRERFDHIESCCSGLLNVEADSANTSLIQFLEFCIGHARVYNGYAARRFSELAERIY